MEEISPLEVENSLDAKVNLYSEKWQMFKIKILYNKIDILFFIFKIWYFFQVSLDIK